MSLDTATTSQVDAAPRQHRPDDPSRHGGRAAGLSRYGAFIRWMIADAFWRFRWLVAGVVVAGSAAIALQIKAIALTVYYTRLFERNQTFELLGRTYNVRQSIALLVGFGIAALLALLASAAMQYASRVWTLHFRRRYGEVCSIRVLEILQGAPQTVPAGPSRFDDAIAISLARSESLLCGRMVSIALGVITPAISFIASIAVLFAVHWALTLLLVAMIGICGIFLYRTNVQAAGHSSAAEKLGRAAVAEFRGLVQRHKSRFPHVPVGDIDPAAAERAVRSDPIKSYFDAYVARLRVVADSELIGNVFLGIVLATILIALGSGAILRGRGWESMVVYLVALRYALVTFRGGMRTVTSFNRFYPQVRRYFDFLRSAMIEPSSTSLPMSSRFTLKVDAPAIEGSLHSVDAAPGVRIALCAPIDLNRYTQPFILSCLLGGGDAARVRRTLESSAWFSSQARLAEGPVGQSLGYTDALWNDLSAMAQHAALHRKLAEQLPDGPTSVIASDARDGINPGLKLMLMMLPAASAPPLWVFVDANDLATIESEARVQLLDRFNRSIVVILHNEQIDFAGQCGESIAAVHDADAQIALGSIEWLKSNASAVQGILSSALPDRKARLEDDDEDDDADDT